MGHPGVVRRRLCPYPEFCDFAAVQYAVIPVVFNLPPGEVTEEQCQCRGDAACTFRLRWQNRDVTESPRAEIRIRAELSEVRLEQIQGMITELASNERYEDVLQGFVRPRCVPPSVQAERCWHSSHGRAVPRMIYSRDSPNGS